MVFTPKMIKYAEAALHGNGEEGVMVAASSMMIFFFQPHNVQRE